MVREQQWPRAGIAPREQCRHAVAHPGDAVVPRQSEDLHALAADVRRRALAAQQRHPAALRLAAKNARVLDEVVIALARRDDVPRAQRPHDVERRRKIAQRVVDEIARERDHVRAEPVRLLDDAFEHTSAREASDVKIRDMRDAHALERGRQVRHRHLDAPDAETIELRLADSCRGECEHRWRERRRGPEKFAPRDGRPGVHHHRSHVLLSAHDAHPPDKARNFSNRRDDCTHDAPREPRQQDDDMPCENHRMYRTRQDFLEPRAAARKKDHREARGLKCAEDAERPPHPPPPQSRR